MTRKLYTATYVNRNGRRVTYHSDKDPTQNPNLKQSRFQSVSFNRPIPLSLFEDLVRLQWVAT